MGHRLPRSDRGAIGATSAQWCVRRSCPDPEPGTRARPCRDPRFWRRAPGIRAAAGNRAGDAIGSQFSLCQGLRNLSPGDLRGVGGKHPRPQLDRPPVPGRDRQIREPVAMPQLSHAPAVAAGLVADCPSGGRRRATGARGERCFRRGTARGGHHLCGVPRSEGGHPRPGTRRLRGAAPGRR